MSISLNNYSNLCRTCLVNCNNIKCYKLFNVTIGGQVPLSVFVEQISGIKVEESDLMPENVCQRCTLGFKAAFMLLKQAKNSELKLQEFAKTVVDVLKTTEDDSVESGNEQNTEGFDITIIKSEKNMENVELPVTRAVSKRTASGSTLNLPEEITSSKRLKTVKEDGISPINLYRINLIPEPNSTKQIIDVVPVNETQNELTLEKSKVESTDTIPKVTKSIDLEETCKSSTPKLRKVYQKKPNVTSNAKSLLEDLKVVDKNDIKKVSLGKKKLLNYSIQKSENNSPQTSSARKKTPEIKSVQSLGQADDAVSFVLDFILQNGDPKKVKQDVEDRKYVCEICPKRFVKKSNLIDHLRLHAGVRQHQCPHCDKSFVQSGNFRCHLRTHTKERPFQCTMCDKSYNQSGALKIHIRSHTNERNYICDLCEKGFTNSSDLAKHRMIHDPNKKYKCEHCDKPFTQKSHLLKHEASKHKKET